MHLLYPAGRIPAVTPLTIIKGDATSPQAKGRKVIAYVYNDLGDWLGCRARRRRD